nr:immunoglobulin heavy chain junction region [Macaca mulatta]MOW98564.1 immunoglobulin heavy chain junction region [Macaca mulatta]MOW98604.1 immunoglobulin heavy chain junction region [Macaca mulatta]MOX00508.1 immunoglobulin heavy chain junction region [Macaca mulatta]MOX00874.1 immunoglobulin heavy chain junction region [Macaca mulatta]
CARVSHYGFRTLDVW